MISKKTKKILIISVISILLFAGIIVLILLYNKPQNNDFEYEDNVMVGLMPGVDRDALLEQMQNNVDKSAIAYSVDSRPKLQKQTLYILFENPEGNDKDLSIEIYDNETGESIYSSKAIKEGSYVPSVKINRTYEIGEHTITVYIKAYEIETHKFIGEAAAELILISE